MELLTTHYQSHRFRFIPLTDKDLELFCDLYCNNIVMGKIMPKLNTAQAKSLFSSILNKHPQRLNEFWRIECALSGQAIGIQGFMANQTQQNQRDAEFGILIKPEFYRNNVATESVTAMLLYGFQHLNLMTAHAFFNPDNIAIHKIAKKLKFAISADTKQTNTVRCCISKSTFLSLMEK